MPQSAAKLKEILRAKDIRPKKSLGQNFLVDANISRKMLNSADIKNNDIILEIGPGLGAVTKDLCSKAGTVYALEIDKKLYSVLSDLLREEKNLKLIHADFLKQDLVKISRGKKIKIVGNLPYYISTPIIIKIIENKKYIKEAYVTIQKEVALRLAAKPGTKDYGSITCFLNYHADTKRLFDISKRCFYPQPQVDSSFVRIKFLDKPRVKVKDEHLFFALVRASFNQRRKTLLNSLSRVINKQKIEKILEEAGIDKRRRGETLSLEEFARIANISTTYN